MGHERFNISLPYGLRKQVIERVGTGWGAFSGLIARLLREWLEKEEKP